MFVKACSILIKPHEIAETHKLLTDFCLQGEALYSEVFESQYALECIRDFGPVCSF